MPSTEKPSRKIFIGVVIAVLTACALWFLRHVILPFCEWVWSSVVVVWNYLLASYSVPGWVTLVLSILAIICVVGWIGSLIKSSDPTKEEGSWSWRDFREMEFAGIKWRWDYGYGGQIENLTCFCVVPDCDMQVFPKICGYYGMGSESNAYTCDRCGHSVRVNEHTDTTLSRVAREIQRLLRNNGWRSVVRH
jgi:hypothetical protein